MKILKDENIRVNLFNDEKTLFKALEDEIQSDQLNIDFCRIKRKKDLKTSISLIIRFLLELEDKYNREITLILPDNNTRRIAHNILRELTPSKIKIGIALGGGGARGALQIGQLRILDENGILEVFDAMAGTSIGSMNMIGYTSFGLDKLEEIWKSNMSKIAYKKRLRLKESMSNVAMFDRNDTKEYMLNLFNDNTFSVDYPEYYINTYSLKERKLKIFHINNRSKERIVEASLASSAIPFIYGISRYDDNVFIDGGVIDNQSIRCLIEKGCNVIFAASLSVYPKCSGYAKDGVCIIDMGSVNFYRDLLSGSFSFDKAIDEKIDHGYKVSKQLFNKLKKLNVLDIIVNKDATKFYKLNTYYNLSKSENKYKFNKSWL